MVMATVLSGIVVSSATILKTSIAAFSATTSNGANTWSSGQLTLNTGSPAASIMFLSGTDGPVAGGQVLQKCITINYDGSWTGTNVKLYGTAGAQTALGQYLNLVVEEGTATSTTGGSCTSFTTGTTITTGKKLKNGVGTGFLDDHSSYATGVGSWSTTDTDGATAGVQDSKAYRFTVTVDSDNDAMGKQAEATFTWEVQK